MTPSKVQARKMVLVSAFLLAAIAVYRDRRGGKSDTFHALWGVGVVSMLLSLLADFAPTIAGPFAALTVLGSLASGDTSIIDRLFGGAAGSTSRAPGSRIDAGGGGDFPASTRPAQTRTSTTPQTRGGQTTKPEPTR